MILRAWLKYYLICIVAVVINIFVNIVVAHTGSEIYGTIYTDYTAPLLALACFCIFLALMEAP